MQLGLGCIVIHVHPRVYELSRVHGFYISSFSFEVWLHRSYKYYMYSLFAYTHIHTCVGDPPGFADWYETRQG